MANQLPTLKPRPVLPKPERGMLGVLGLDVVGDGRAVGCVVVAVRVNKGRRQWLLLLVRVQLPPLPPENDERRGEHCGASARGTAGAVTAACALLGCGQSGGVMA